MLPKVYDPAGTEDRIYRLWEDSGAFKAEVKSGKEAFSVSMPPPNATGQLHLGHAVMLALEDIFIRFARMRGKEALWVPGTDHASIATESVVIRRIQKEEKIADPRKAYGREKLVKTIREFVEASRGTIRSQMRKMGSSCDWSRERYTMDPVLARTTYEVFVDMYRREVIYRGHRMVNWDPKLQTTLADDEVVREERREPYYTFQYGPFRISTSRPETKFGDKYVVMHPEDKRYAKYKHGDTFEAEWINGHVKATVIKDSAVDPAFGTGAMTITPWHDSIDFDMAERHKLDKEQIIDFDGRLLPIAGEFAGMHILDARPKIVEKLKAKGLLVSVDENYMHNVAVSSRGGGLVEPQIKEQWFIDVNKKAVPWKGKQQSIKEVMQDVVRSKLITIVPDRFEKTYFQWIDNLRDWCISRQIWWGHRIPAWYRDGEIHVGMDPPEGKGWEQDSDTLDTWYGVSQWTWSTLIDPKAGLDRTIDLKEVLAKSPDFRKFHPTSVMETGYDILFFWVARMILMTTYTMSVYKIGKDESERIPFKTVYLHGLIRTRDGKKMSKSHPETIIDPLDMIAKYGADALRLSMIVGQSPGADSKLYEEKIAGYRNFVNKLWNASRFVLMKCAETKVDPQTIDDAQPSSIADQALMYELIQLRNDVTGGIEHYRLSEAGDRLYAFVWDFFCDWYLELSKGTANPGTLVIAMREILQLLHPYCPYVTEELWAHFKQKDAGMLMKHPWPLPLAASGGPWEKAREQLQIVIDAITTLRKIRADQGIEAGKPVTAFIHSKKHQELLEEHRDHIIRMAKVGAITIDEKPATHQNVASVFLPGVEVHVSLQGLVDPAAMKKEQAELQKYVASVEAKLDNKTFVNKAPAKIVDEMKQKLTEAKDKLEKIAARLG